MSGPSSVMVIDIVGGARAEAHPLYACNQSFKCMLYICNIVIITKKKLFGEGSGFVSSLLIVSSVQMGGEGQKKQGGRSAHSVFNETQADL